MKNTKEWPTDNEEHRRWCENCQGKYIGVRKCPDCEGRNTFIDEVVLRPLKYKNNAAVALGSIKSEKKASSSKKNGKLGGRPSKSPLPAKK